MSYTVTATQARLFGFNPKYAWDAFAMDHGELAMEIKKSTFSSFMEIEMREMEIKKRSEEILRREKISALRYCMGKKEEKKQMMAEVQMDMKGMERVGMMQRKGGKEEGEGYEGEIGPELDWDVEEEEEGEMKKMEDEAYERDELDEYMYALKTKSIKWNRERKKLEKELEELREENRQLKGEVERMRTERIEEEENGVKKRKIGTDSAI